MTSRSASCTAALWLSLLVAITAIGAIAQDDPQMTLEGVTDLTSDTFDMVVGKDAAVLVEFYAPWCGHCKNLVPEYQRLGQAVKGNKEAANKIIIAKIHANDNKDISNRFEVTGFPTILFFPAGSQTPVKYDQARDLAGFLEFLNEKVGTTLIAPYMANHVVELSPANFDRIVMDPTKGVFVAFTAPWCGHCKRLKPVLRDVSVMFKAEPSVVIAELNADEAANAGIRDEYKIKSYPTIYFFPLGDKSAPMEYRGGRDPTAIRNFINRQCKVDRTQTGDLGRNAGVIEALEGPVEAFVAAVTKADKEATEAAKSALISATEGLSANEQEAGKQYVRYMERIAEKGIAYVTTEIERLERVLMGNVKGAKRDGVIIRSNILRAFTTE